MEVRTLQRGIDERFDNQTNNCSEDIVLKRVNQTFDKMAQDVKELIDENIKNNKMD
jgi:hypothetical protein